MRRYRQTTAICLACGAALAGLVFSRRAGGLPVWIVLFLLVCMVVSFKKLRVFSLYVLISFAFVFGWWRGGLIMDQLRGNLAVANRKVEVYGIANSDGVYNERRQMSFDIRNAAIAGTGDKLAGIIAVSGFGAGSVNRGDFVQATGKLYPTRGSHTFSISYAPLTVIPGRQSAAEKFRHGFNAGMYTALPEPLGSFALGLLVGQRSTIPKDLSDKLSVVGLTHIVAVSGYNLTIIIAFARRFLNKRSKFQSLCVSFLLIASFLAVTGLSASIVRAAIISSLGLLAWYYGRTLKPMVLILFTAAVTAAWNPFYLWSDIGWYLSFLAFFGILVLAPLLEKRLFGSAKTPAAAGVVIETVAAEAMTLPLIMFIFGKLSLIGLAANVLVVPMVPLAMLASFAAGLSGMMIPVLSGWIAYPARLVLTYMVDLVLLLARIPHASVSLKLNTSAMAMVYLCVLLLLLTLWRKTHKTGTITDIEQARAG